MDLARIEPDPPRDLTLALRSAESLQDTIRHADTKAQMLLGVDGCVAAVAAGHLPGLLALPAPASLFAVVCAAVMLVGLTTSAARLIRVIAPEPFHRFEAGAAVSGHADQDAREFVATLTRIAAAKHRRVRHGVRPLVVATTAGGVLLALSIGASVL
jgi:hypothetical protein